MALNAKTAAGSNGGGKKVAQPNMEPGTYPVRLVQIIDFGLQPQRAYKGEDKAPAQEVGLTYEFVDCFLVDEEGNELEDKPRWVSEIIPLRNLKADLATSTKRIKALDPDNVHDGDLTQMVGCPANATITVNESKGKVYTNIAGLTPMRPKDAAKCPELKNPTKVFDLSDPDLEVFNSFPDWIKDKIKGNLNYAGSKLAQLLGEEGQRKDVPKAGEQGREKAGESEQKELADRAGAEARVQVQEPNLNEEPDLPW